MSKLYVQFSNLYVRISKLYVYKFYIFVTMSYIYTLPYNTARRLRKGCEKYSVQYSACILDSGTQCTRSWCRTKTKVPLTKISKYFFFTNRDRFVKWYSARVTIINETRKKKKKEKCGVSIDVFIHHPMSDLVQSDIVRALLCQGCSRNYPGGGGVGRRHFFVLWVEGVLSTCPRGGGNLSWGSRRIWSRVGRVTFKITYVSWGSGGSDSICVLGVEGPEKKMRTTPREDNFWNSPDWNYQPTLKPCMQTAILFAVSHWDVCNDVYGLLQCNMPIAGLLICCKTQDYIYTSNPQIHTILILHVSNNHSLVINNHIQWPMVCRCSANTMEHSKCWLFECLEEDGYPRNVFFFFHSEVWQAFEHYTPQHWQC